MGWLSGVYFSPTPTLRLLNVLPVEPRLRRLGERHVERMHDPEPAESIVRAVSDRQAHVLGVSVTMTFHVHLVSEIIARVRKVFGERVKVLVGGYPFNVAPDLWRRVGADASAPDAQRAIAEAHRLVAAEGGNGSE